MRFRSFVIAAVVLVAFLASSCGRQRSFVTTGELSKKLEKDPVAANYAKFLISDLEKYTAGGEKALAAINELIDVSPDTGYFYYQRATINAGASNWGAVVEDCKLALKKNPSLVEAKILLGKVLGILKRDEEAIKYLEEAQKAVPEREEIFVLLAKEYMNAERYRHAEKIMLDLLKRDSEALIAYYYLGALYGSYLKEPGRAIEIYKRLLEREPENSQIIDAISQLYFEQGRVKEALDILLRLEGDYPTDITLKLKLAILYYKLKDYPQAISRFEEILKSNQKSDKIIYYLGVMYEEVGKFDMALNMYKQVSPKSELYKDARLRLAYRYKEEQKIKEAEKILKEGIRKSPQTIELYQYLAGMYEKTNDYKAAIELLTAASKRFPSDERFLFAIGVFYERIGDIDKAVAAMQKVLKVNPKNVNALNYVGYTYIEQDKNLDEAEELLQQAALLKPNDGFVVDSLGWLYFKKGDLTRAYVLLSRAIKLEPDEPVILKHMGIVYMERGEKKKALEQFKKALKFWEKKEIVDSKEVNELISLIEKASQ